ncbi:MAG: flavodoxin family protein [Methanosphaera sp.]|nr:flavodoxin family protein [Methanosphaera sp.]
MKIIGINTSPRENGNARIALVKALEAAEAKGAETEIFDTNKMNIGACQADNYCKAHEGKCPVDDDMQKIYRAIEEADGVILASPVYFFDVCAQAKLVIDRMYAYFQSPFVETYGQKKFSLIATQGTPDADAFKDVIQVQANAFGFLGFEVCDVAILTDNNVPGAIESKDDQIDLAKKVGENIAN